MIKLAPIPTKPVVEEGGRFAKDNGCDFIVALGGGSVMDASKVIGIMATNESDDLWDYVMFGTGKKVAANAIPSDCCYHYNCRNRIRN